MEVIGIRSNTIPLSLGIGHFKTIPPYGGDIDRQAAARDAVLLVNVRPVGAGRFV